MQVEQIVNKTMIIQTTAAQLGGADCLLINSRPMCQHFIDFCYL